jgi:hypothetical protein
MTAFSWPRSTAAAPLRATVSVLQNLEPVAARLRAVLGEFGALDRDPDARLAREGRLAVFEGDPAQARRLNQALRAVGLSTSLNQS